MIRRRHLSALGLAVTLTMVALTVAGCQILKSTPVGMRARVSTITGTLTLQGADPVPEGSLAEITLSDVSRADASAIVLAQMRMPAGSGLKVLKFQLGYDPAAILPNRPLFYAVNARIITPQEQLLWINDTAYYLPENPGRAITIGNLDLIRVK